jgi:fluoride exporter
LIWLGVILAGGLGAVLRFLLDGAVARRAGKSRRLAGLPFGTLAVNISGAALLGFLGALALSRYAALLAGTAFVGSYTTFSTWMLET